MRLSCLSPDTCSRGTRPGLLGYLVIEGVSSLDLGFLAWNRAGHYVAGGVIVGAALYQLTRAKGVCLRHCRTPPMLARRWRPGRLGALRTGLEHGTFCIGSSWASMTVLFVLGLMSLGWMAFIAALVALEKLLPWEAPANRGIAASLAVLGLTVAFAPAYVPGVGDAQLRAPGLLREAFERPVGHRGAGELGAVVAAHHGRIAPVDGEAVEFVDQVPSGDVALDQARADLWVRKVPPTVYGTFRGSGG